ncbi:leucine-rich repeat protein [Bifidobacterium sp. ESL0775]|uniref:leucine-rich repeat protein n=1 Tax=Bifidobacterium sp. ESL0775 TaxID=2983230 RepID=UPI0023F8995E|nr:leucine-rich repeat protein [Bifidobacterium sp. ESL0775]WEV69424.1 leucine-rich repeat protein [Bifidobacterium sp. ESL0775]
MHNNDDFDPPPQAGHQNSLNQPGKTTTSSQAAPSWRDTNASAAAHTTKSAVVHSSTPSKPDATRPDTRPAPNAARSRTTPFPSAKAQPNKPGKANGHPSASPTTQSVMPSPAAQSGDTSKDEAMPSLRVQSATLPTTQSPVLAKTDTTALATAETTPGPQADPDTDGTTGQTQDAIPQEPVNTSGSGLRSAAAGTASGRRTRRGNTTTGAEPAGATGVVHAAADHDDTHASTPQAQGEPEAGPQDTCTATTPAAWDTSDVTWNIDATCTLHLSGGTHTSNTSGAMPWDTLKTTITSIHIDGDLTLDAGSNSGYVFSGMTSLRSVATGAPVHLKNWAAASMFRDDTSLATVDLTNWYTTIVGDVHPVLNYMFYNCSSLTTLDLPNFTSSSVGHYMFDGCSRLTTLNLHNFGGGGIYFLDGCNSLVSLDLYSADINNFSSVDTYFPASLRKLAITGAGRSGPPFSGPNEVNPLMNISSSTWWDETSGLGDHIDYLGKLTEENNPAYNLAYHLWTTSSPGYYVDDSLVHVESTVDIDPAGGSASPASYTRDNKLTDQAVGVPASILTNKPGCLFDGWKDQNGKTYTSSDGGYAFAMPQGKYTYYRLTAQWKPFAPSIDAPHVRSSWDGYRTSLGSWLNVGINTAAPTGSQTSVRTGRGGTGTCNATNTTGTTCRINWNDVASLEPTPGATYSVTATTTGTDPKTGKQVSAPYTRTGTLPWMTVKFSAGTLADGTHPSGTPPNDLTAGLVAENDSYITTSLPRRGGLSVPDDTWFDGWAYSDNTQVSGCQYGSCMVNFSHGNTDASGHMTVTLTASWKTMGAPKITDLSVGMDGQSVEFEISAGIAPDGRTTTASTSTGWSSAACTNDPCTVDVPVSSFQTGYGDTYTITATSRATNPDTGRAITKTTTKSGVLDYYQVSFDKGEGGGSAPGPVYALITTVSGGMTLISLPGQSGMTPPSGGSFRGWSDTRSGVVYPGSSFGLSQEKTTADGHRYSFTLTASWYSFEAPAVHDPVVHAKAGHTATVDIDVISQNITRNSEITIDTGRTGGHANCSNTPRSNNTSECTVTWDLDKLADTGQGSTYTYAITTSITSIDPGSGLNVTRSRTMRGALPYMTVTFDKGTAAGAAPDPASAPVDTADSTAAPALPGMGSMSPAAGSYLSAWARGSDSWPAGVSDIPVAKGDATDAAKHTTIALTAQWSAMGAVTISEPRSSVSSNGTESLSVFVTSAGAPDGSTAVFGSAGHLVSCAFRSGACEYSGPLSGGPLDGTPGTPYSISATVNYKSNGLVIAQPISTTTPKTGTLSYMTINFTPGTGGTGTPPTPLLVLADTGSYAAVPTLPDSTGLAGPTGTSFSGWNSAAADTTWPAGQANIPANAGTATGIAGTMLAKHIAVTLDATWVAVPGPTHLAAAYHHAGNGTVTLSGTAQGSGGDIVKACMTGGNGGADTCKDATNPRPAADPFTPVTSGNPRVESFTPDPTDPGKIAVKGHIDRVNNNANTRIQIVICPQGATEPTDGGHYDGSCTLVTPMLRPDTARNNSEMMRTNAEDNVPWGGHYIRGHEKDKEYTTKDGDFSAGPGLYDIWAVANLMTNSTPLSHASVYRNYPYKVAQALRPWNWSVSFDASDYTSRYGVGAEHHFTAQQTSGQLVSGKTDSIAILPWLKVAFAPDMPGGATATAPEPATGLIDIDDASRPADVTLAGPTESMEPADAAFQGWSATEGAATPDTGMGDPTRRTVTLNADTGDVEIDTTLHAVWRKLHAPSLNATANTTFSGTTFSGTATPWTSSEGYQATATGLEGQSDNALGTPQAATLGGPGGYDGHSEHTWSVTIPLRQGGHYRVTAAATEDDGAWRGSSRIASATTSRDFNLPKQLRTLPLTGGTPQRLAAILALLLGATLLLLAAATRLRDRRREQRQGRAR